MFIIQQVTFVGEGAVDHGGLKREFLVYLPRKHLKRTLREIIGQDFFANNTMALQEGMAHFYSGHVQM